MMINKTTMPPMYQCQAQSNNTSNVYHLNTQEPQWNKPDAIYPFARKRNDERGKGEHHVNAQTEILDVRIEFQIEHVYLPKVNDNCTISHEVQDCYTRLDQKLERVVYEMAVIGADNWQLPHVRGKPPEVNSAEYRKL